MKSFGRVIVGAGASTALLGLVIWLGYGYGLGPIHMILGIVFVLAVWIAAFFAARAGAPARAVGCAIGWSVALLALGVAQKALLPGAWHWTIQALHAVTGVGAMMAARRLVMGRWEAPAPRQLERNF